MRGDRANRPLWLSRSLAMATCFVPQAVAVALGHFVRHPASRWWQGFVPVGGLSEIGVPAILILAFWLAAVLVHRRATQRYQGVGGVARTFELAFFLLGLPLLAVTSLLVAVGLYYVCAS
jgi:hypothetical protein